MDSSPMLHIMCFVMHAMEDKNKSKPHRNVVTESRFTPAVL
jgi:hypothetical protein